MILKFKNNSCTKVILDAKFILQIQTLDDLLDELDQLKRPFHRFVERYDMVMDLYKSFCDFLRRYVESIEWKLLSY